MQALLQHIKDLNAKARAWVAEAPGRWSSEYTEDLTHWAEYGISTPEEFDHHMLVSNVWESHRAVFGYKANWTRLMALSNEELEAELHHIQGCAEQERKNQEWLRQQEIESNSNLAQRLGYSVATLIRWGVIDRIAA